MTGNVLPLRDLPCGKVGALIEAPGAEGTARQEKARLRTRPGENGMGSKMVLRLHSTPMSVRAALMQVREALQSAAVPGSDLGRLELVLAEAMNNIVEHAYLDSPDGRIVVRLTRDPDALSCEIIDTGTAMPDDALPQGDHPMLPSIDDLPEGGFGWFMIRELAETLRYNRRSGRNCLYFRLALTRPDLAEDDVQDLSRSASA